MTTLRSPLPTLRRGHPKWLLLIGALALAVVGQLAFDSAAQPKHKAEEYVGAKKCKN